MLFYLQYIDYFGTLALALTGAFIAAEIEMDLFGMIFLAAITSMGGGTLRDIVLGIPVFWISDPTYLYIALGSGPLVFLTQSYLLKLGKLLFALDTIGLSFYAIIGVHKTLSFDHLYIVAFVMGVITAVLGGIIRSLFSQEVSILYKRELYATVAAFASLTYLGLNLLGIDQGLCILITTSLTFVFRTVSIKYDIGLPKITVD